MGDERGELCLYVVGFSWLFERVELGRVCVCACVLLCCVKRVGSKCYGIERRKKWWRVYSVMTAVCPIHSLCFFVLRSLPPLFLHLFVLPLTCPPHQSGHHTLFEMTQTRPDRRLLTHPIDPTAYLL